MVNKNQDDKQLASAIKDLAAEHENFFKCAVTPGFNAQNTQGEIPYLPAKLAGSALIPTAAREFRNYYLWRWLHDAGRVSKPADMQTKFGIDISLAEDIAYDPGAFFGSLGQFTGTFWKRQGTKQVARNATYKTSGSHIALTELSSAAGPDTKIALEIPTTRFTFDVKGRESSLKPKIAFLVLGVSNR